MKISFLQILYIEALADYVIINTENRKHIVHHTMKGFADRLPASSFVHIHRSYIINVDRAEAIEDNSVIIGNKHIPIGASYREEFLKKFNYL